MLGKATRGNRLLPRQYVVKSSQVHTLQLTRVPAIARPEASAIRADILQPLANRLNTGAYFQKDL